MGRVSDLQEEALKKACDELDASPVPGPRAVARQIRWSPEDGWDCRDIATHEFYTNTEEPNE